MSGALASIALGRLFGLRAEGVMPRTLLIAVFVWHFIGLAVAVVVGAIAGTMKVASLIANKIQRRRTVHPPIAADLPRLSTVDESPVVSRRELLVRAASLTPIAATLAATATSQIELSEFRVRPLDVPLANLPSALDGLTIAHVSDVHLGRFTTDATFRRIVAAANDLDCDLVLQTGDLINYDQRDLPVAAELSHALRGRFGQFMCEGNHDLIEGRETFEASARKLRLPILIDEIAAVKIRGVEINLLGLPWVRAERGQSLDAAHLAVVSRLARRASANAFPILLAHHPHAFDAAIASNLPLTLAGHTHGGQLHLSKNIGFGPLLYRYWSGLYRNSTSVCVVSNGAGNWFPLRANAPAEILRLTLRRA